MKAFSTFSGIGGFDLALQINGIEVVGHSEIDRFAEQIYKLKFNNPNYGDITKINPSELPDFDLLVGGFPCQAFSIAGKRGGFSDARGGLFFDLARILRIKQPRCFLFENVKGLLSHDNGKTFATVTKAIAELGYSFEWQVLNSKNFGVPQNRERVFIIGYFGRLPRRKIFPLARANGRIAQTGVVPVLTPDRIKKRQHGRRFKNDGDVAFTLTSQDRHGINQINNPKHSNDRVYSSEGISPTLNTMQGGMRQPKILAHYGHKNKSPVEMDISLTLKAQSHGHEPMVKELILRDGRDNRGCLRSGRVPELGVTGHSIRRLTPLECERLQSFPDGWTEFGIGENGVKIKISNAQRYKTLGNAVTVSVVEYIIEKLII
ncbi:DNA (cytosine-5-)-methyltransferase [Candidatus Peregrinibacteria bacterium]|nr:MAG: DNA (cytosine-5-)-methyltransferase [Candidatus Peregrinibacteria bacterium]